MTANILLVSEVFTKPETLTQTSNNWARISVPESVLDRKIYESTNGKSVLELVALSAMELIWDLRFWWMQCRDAMAQQMKGDFHRQLLEFVEAPKATQSLLPETPFIQLRHIEVRLPVYEDYIAWRNRTIFSVVNDASEIDVFLAYHSLISTEPGVMFLAGFSCDEKDYLSVFNSERYKDIVRQAGAKYIADGEAGLYTKTYRQVH